MRAGDDDGPAFDVGVDGGGQDAERVAECAADEGEEHCLGHELGADVVPAEQLLEKVWDEMADPFTTTVKATIHRLRSKLGDPPVIHTIPQDGYRILARCGSFSARSGCA